MPLLADPTAPSPNPNGGGASQQALSNLAVLMQQQQQQSTSDPANVPLWMVRPTGAAQGMQTARALGAIDTFPGVNSPTDPQTKAFAQQYWLDMSDEDKKAFAQQAMAADMWKPTQGAFGLAQAWTQAVDLAQNYNTAHPDQSKWLSPFEAIKKLAPEVAAGKQAAYNGYSQTTRVTQFRENDLYGQAKSILQNNLGRDPTPQELQAFTIAVNAAAAKSPQVVTTQQSKADGTGDTQQVVYGGQFDPTQTIDNMVRKTDEYAHYQAAVDYFPAVMQALGAVVS